VFKLSKLSAHGHIFLMLDAIGWVSGDGRELCRPSGKTHRGDAEVAEVTQRKPGCVAPSQTWLSVFGNGLPSVRIGSCSLTDPDLEAQSTRICHFTVTATKD